MADAALLSLQDAQFADFAGTRLHLEQLRMAVAAIEPLGVILVRKEHWPLAAVLIEQDIDVENRGSGGGFGVGVGTGARSDQALRRSLM